MLRPLRRSCRAALVITAAASLSLSACRRNVVMTPTAAASSTISHSIVVGGLTRTYLLHRPSNLPPHPAVVISLHGGGGTAAGQERLTGYDAVADAQHFVVVYPQGYDNGWADGRGTNQAEKQHVDDDGFISELIDRLIATDAVDPARVFVSGFSNGAFMTQRLGCDLAKRIAAIAAVSGTLGTDVRCAPANPVSVLEIHGTDDPVVPFKGGHMRIEAGGPSTIVSAPDMTSQWRSLDDCAAASDATLINKVDDGTSVRVTANQQCADHTSVAFYEVQGGGHTWPQGKQYLPTLVIGRTSQEFSASQVSWDFFKSHPKG